MDNSTIMAIISVTLTIVGIVAKVGYRFRKKICCCVECPDSPVDQNTRNIERIADTLDHIDHDIHENK